MLLAYGLSIALILIILTRLYRKYWRLIQLGSRFPGPPALPLIGNAHQFIFLSPEICTLYVIDNFKKYGNTIRLWIGPELNILTSDLSFVEHVLSSTSLIEKASQYRYLKDWLNDGLLLSSGRKYLNRRKLITPSFHFQMLAPFIRIFEEQSSVLVEQMRMFLKSDQAFDFHELISLFALDAISESAMGVVLNAQTNNNCEYVNAIKTLSNVIHLRMLNAFYRFDIIFKYSPLARKQSNALRIIHNLTDKIIEQRRKELLKSAGDSKEDNAKMEIGARRKLNFLDGLLQMEIDGHPLSDLDIREEVNTFMFGGHDTTASALTFLIYNLALHPVCQQKCFDEIMAIMGTDKSEPLTLEQLNRLHYVEQCIKETMRQYATVPVLGRRVTQECEINGQILPAGCNIGIVQMHLGQREDLFPEPEVFKPQRFEVGTSAERPNPHTYIPFSAGPRNCVGQKFAMLEMKCVVVNVLRNYVLEYVGEAPILTCELVMGCKDPLMFKIKSRIK